MTIIGVDGPEETILSANNQGRIFKFVNMDKVVIEGITLKDGLTFGNDPSGGAIFAENINSFTVENSIFFQNSAQSVGGAVRIFFVDNSLFRNVKFIQNEVFSDCNNCSFGGGASGVHGNPINHRIEFDNCLFERNGVESNGNDVYLSGTLDVSEVALTVKNYIFRSNFINSSGSNGNADGVVFKLHLGPQNSWSSIPNSVIERSLFEDNSVSASNNNSTLLLSTATKTLLQNNLIVNNNSSEPYRFFRSDPSYDSNGNGPEIRFQNNTIYNNKAESFMEAVGFGAKVEFINNIIWENNFPNGNEFNYAENDGVTISY